MAQRNVGIILTGVGFEAVILVAGSAYIGSKLDKHYKLNGIATVVLVLLAMFGWMVRVFTLVKQVNKENNQDKGPPSG